MCLCAYVWIARFSKPGCTLPEIWDVEDASNRHRKSTCSQLHACAEPYFRRVFANAAYHVLRVKKPAPFNTEPLAST